MFSPQQVQQILRGFADYHAKLGATKIIREVSPSRGYWVDDKFYTEESILAPFKDAYAKIKASNSDDNA